MNQCAVSSGGVPYNPLNYHGLAQLREDASGGDAGIVIAVVDGPVDLNHASFESVQLRAMKTLVDSGSGNNPAMVHGTHVAGILFGQEQGVAPGCRGLVLNIFGTKPDGSIRAASQIDVARAITQAVEAGAHVINMSGGEFADAGSPSPFLEQAIEYCQRHGVLLVAATGNDGCDCFHYPAGIPTVLAVGAMDDEGRPLCNSNWGGSYGEQGILAPGKKILGPKAGGGMMHATGSSFACPIVSGVIALFLSLQIKEGLKPDPIQVRDVLLKTARRCESDREESCERYLVGQLDIEAARLALFGQVEPANAPEISSSSSLVIAEEPPAKQEAVIPQSEDVELDMDDFESEDPESADHIEGSLADTELLSFDRVLPLGRLDHDFISETRRDAFRERIGGDPDDGLALLAYLEQHPWEAEAVVWLLCIRDVPAYRIVPDDLNGQAIYKRLRAFYKHQLQGDGLLIGLPGHSGARRTLKDGDRVLDLHPIVWAMDQWQIKKLEAGLDRPKQKDLFVAFMERIAGSFCNLGRLEEERAMNFVGHVLSKDRTLVQAFLQGLELRDIKVEETQSDKSVMDVKLIFFDPVNLHGKPHSVYRYTLDLSDVVPCLKDGARHYFVYV